MIVLISPVCFPTNLILVQQCDLTKHKTQLLPFYPIKPYLLDIYQQEEEGPIIYSSDGSIGSGGGRLFEKTMVTK